MAFDYKAWEQAKQYGTVPRWKYRGLDGVHETFGDALMGYGKLVDFKAREQVEELLHDFKKLEKPWRTFVRSRGLAAAQAYIAYTGDPKDRQAFELMHETEEELLNDANARAQWVVRQVNERILEIKSEIKILANIPGGEHYDMRDEFPLEGVYCKGGNYVIPISAIVGFCPRCHEPIVLDSLEEIAADEFSMKCTACIADGPVKDLESEHGWYFDCLPFTDVPVADVNAA